MSAPADISLMLAQLGQTDRTAQELLANPEIQRQIAQHAAPELLRRDNEQISVTQKNQDASKIGTKHDKDAASRRRNKQKEKKQKQPQDAAPANVALSPCAGHLVNVKI